MCWIPRKCVYLAFVTKQVYIGYQLDYEWVALFTMNIFISNPIHTEYMFSTYLYSSASLLDKEDAKRRDNCSPFVNCFIAYPAWAVPEANGLLYKII